MVAFKLPTEYDFDDENAQPQVVPFKYKRKRYELREPDADQVILWRSWCVSKMVPNQTGNGPPMVPGPGFHDNEPYLVSLCVVEIVGPGKEKPVPLAQVRKWQYRMLEKLFNHAKVIGGIVEDDTISGLEKKIKELQEKLDLLKKDHPEYQSDGQAHPPDAEREEPDAEPQETLEGNSPGG